MAVVKRRKSQEELKEDEVKNKQDNSTATDEENDDLTEDEINDKNKTTEIKTPVVGVKEVVKEQEFRNLTEMFKEETIFIFAKNMVDAEKLLRDNIETEDKVVSLRSTNKGYRAEILTFIARGY